MLWWDASRIGTRENQMIPSGSPTKRMKPSQEDGNQDESLDDSIEIGHEDNHRGLTQGQGTGYSF
jgi:hypothetical protein